MHRLDVRSKFVWVTSVILLSVAGRTDLQLLLGFVILVLLPLIALRPPANRVKSYASISLAVMATSVFSQGLFYYGLYQGEAVTPILWILPPDLGEAIPVLGHVLMWATMGKGICLSVEGLRMGLNVGLRILIAVLAGGIFLMSTRPGDVILVLNSLRMPFPLVFTMVTALRFLPTFFEEYTIIHANLRLKGFKLGLRSLIRAVKLVLTAIIFNSVRRANAMAIALEVKAFRAVRRRTVRKRTELTRKDLLFSVSSVMYVLAVLTLLPI